MTSATGTVASWIRVVAERIAFAAFAWTLVACTSIPLGKKAVTAFEIEGVTRIDGGDLESKLATRATSKFLWLFRGVVYDYETLDKRALERDVQRIERFYRARGFYDAKVTKSEAVPKGDDKVAVVIVVVEGEPVVVRGAKFEGIETLSPAVRFTLERVAFAHAPTGRPFDETSFETAEAAIADALTNVGRARAKVKRSAIVDVAHHVADLTFTVDAGPELDVGEIVFEGLDEIPETKVRQVFDVARGERYSSGRLKDGRQALLDLGVFASVEVEPDLSDEATAKGAVPIKVTAELTKLRSLLVGGGLEFDAIRTDLHLIFGWENANFLGGLRHQTFKFKPGLVFFPTRITNIRAPSDVLPEERLSGDFRQPGFLEARTTGVLRGEYNVYPLILPVQTSNVVGYHEVRSTAGVERTIWKLFTNPMYGIQANFPFDYVKTSSQPLTPVVVSYAELVLAADFRDSALKPRKGVFFGTDLQYAGLGGDAQDFRAVPEVRGYLPLGRRLTIAARTSVGFLFPQNYGQSLAKRFGPNGAQDVADAELTRDYQILFFRGFFGGGPNSNRGYALRGIGPHDVIPFLNPVVQTQLAANACTGTAADPPECKLPTGGLSQWEASLEARILLAGPLSTALFCDAGDVSPNRVDLRFDRLHLSCGAGARYDTPVGPIRLDVAYRIPGVQTLGSNSGEGVPGTIFGAPIAIAFGIGEAF
ncbi:MAG: BamA/TamA family outer membrane protein [Polyangiaceae bacterium]